MTRLCRWERCQRRHVEHSPWCLEHRGELLHRMYASSPHEAGSAKAGLADALEPVTNTASAVSRGRATPASDGRGALSPSRSVPRTRVTEHPLGGPRPSSS